MQPAFFPSSPWRVRHHNSLTQKYLDDLRPQASVTSHMEECGHTLVTAGHMRCHSWSASHATTEAIERKAYLHWHLQQMPIPPSLSPLPCSSSHPPQQPKFLLSPLYTLKTSHTTWPGSRICFHAKTLSSKTSLLQAANSDPHLQKLSSLDGRCRIF